MRLSEAEYQILLARERARLGGSIGTTAPARQPKTERESDIQDAIEAECRRRGWVAFRSRMDRATTRPLGEPDFTIMADAGRVFFVETKSRTGKFTREQAGLHMLAEKLGHRVHVVRSLEEFISVTLQHNPTHQNTSPHDTDHK